MKHTFHALVLVSAAVAAWASPPSHAAAPPLGLALPCRVVSVHDGDTLTVDVTIRANVRLCGDGKRQCWAPELKQPGGKESRDNLLAIAHEMPGVIFVPATKADNLADLFTMGRVIGDVWVGGESLSEYQVRTKHASTKKGGELGR